MFEEITDPSARVRALCDYGCQVDIDENIPPRRYFRSGLEMIRMANVYYEEGNIESAFVLYSKFITLFVEKLPKHADYKSSTKSERETNKKKLQLVFPRAEAIKTKLTKLYTEQEKRRQEEQKTREAALVAEQAREKEDAERRRREEAERREEEERRRHQQEEDILLEQEEQLRRLKEQERIKFEQEEAERRRLEAAAAAAMTQVSITDNSSTPMPSIPPPSYSSVVAPPARPGVPSRDLKPSGGGLPTAPHPSLVNTVPVLPPVFDRSTKPLHHFTSSGATTENKHGLRTVLVPAEIVVKFVNMALPNTSRNVETCGILCGKMSHNAFRISHLIIPKQSGTSDSCTTESEEQVFDYQDTHDLITLGWIHTHPSQTAFLSSVDLHTHCSYQLMLPEAVAIVCAPKYEETGYFHLTPDHGLQFIANCNKSGFHPHPSSPALFDTCPHVQIDRGASITVVDLRS